MKHEITKERPNMNQGGISVVLNTYQAEKYLDRVLDSVSWADEIVVVDMHSTDRTREIARGHNAKVILTERCRYCEPARNLAIRSASNPWVLVLDADELVPPDLVPVLREFAKGGKGAALAIPRRNWFMGREMHALYPDYVTRFMAKDSVDWPAEIHSQPVIEGDMVRIPKHCRDLALIHLEENTLQSRREKINRYTDFEVDRRGAKRYSTFARALKPGARFLRSFVAKGGWRDGKAGYEWAKLEAEYKRTTIRKQEDAWNKEKTQ